VPLLAWLSATGLDLISDSAGGIARLVATREPRIPKAAAGDWIWVFSVLPSPTAAAEALRRGT
jgi:hypothetical protein